MAVIKCSNCENEILDTEIVCPYCNCPISETIKKMKNEDLKAYSDKTIGGINPNNTKTDEPKIATSADFAREKAAILRDLGINVPPEEDNSAKAEEKNNQVSDTPIEDKPCTEDATSEVPTDKTVKISLENSPSKQAEKPADASDNTSHTTTVKRTSDIISKKTGEAPKPPVRKAGDSAKPPARKPGEPVRIPPKKNKKKSKGKYAILAVTIIGIIIVIYLIWGIAGSISENINKTKKVNKIVKVVESDANSDADLGFELHSSTLTITSDDVMIDYDSPQDTPWYEHKDKIKHITFGKNVTRIGAHSFEGYENITDINISDSVKTIGNSAFCNCTGLVKITNMSKNLEEIDDYAFTGCKNLSKIPGYTEKADFEPVIERIGVEAFKSCKSLTAFKVATYTQIDTDAFYGHGDEFVLICRKSSEAYSYAAEKGIPTKTSFDSEEASEATEEYLPNTSIPTHSQQTTQTSNNTSKEIKKEQEDKKDTETKKDAETNADSSKKDDENNSNQSSTNDNTQSTTSSTPSPSTATSSNNGSVPVAGTKDGGPFTNGNYPQTAGSSSVGTSTQPASTVPSESQVSSQPSAPSTSSSQNTQQSQTSDPTIDQIAGMLN